MSDSRQLAIPGSEGAELATRLVAYERACEVAGRYVAEPHAPATQRAYKVAWEAWGRYCADRRVSPLPVEPVELVTHLQWLSEHLAPNSVRLRLAALVSLDQAVRVTPTDREPSSVRSHPIVQRWLKGWSRDHSRAPRRQAPALTARELELVLRAAAEPARYASGHAHAARYCRDRAMMLVGIGAGTRVDELVRLELADVVLADRGLRVRVRRGKADQAGEGRTAGILPQGRELLCPVSAWRAWLAFRGDWDGPAFSAISRKGDVQRTAFTTRGAADALQARARRVGLELVSSHSLRATLATLAGEQGKTVQAVMRQGGWTSPATAIGYMRQGALFNADNPTAGLLESVEPTR